MIYYLQGVFMLLSSIISPSAVSSSVIYSSSISMITRPGCPQYGATVFFVLIILIFLKEILLSSQTWSKYLNSSFNLAIIPFIFCFAAVVAYKIMMII